MTRKSTDKLEREVWIVAKPETVYTFLTEPEKMTRWMGIEAEADTKPGGIYRVNVTGEDIARGEFMKATPFNSLVFTWGWEGGTPPPGTSTVEITLAADGDGTRLRVVHSGLPADSVAGHGEGWDHYLERLGIAASGSEPGPDSWCKTETILD